MTDIQEFYTDQSVLVTGATGFLGKALVEKLLRSCTEVNTIYILIRSKAGWSVQSRLTQLLDSPLFNKLKEENPEALDKIYPIEGDIGLMNLGLKLMDKSVLISKVNVVIHSAATVHFDAPLDHSLNLNVLGVKRIVELCKQMKNLKALVHISTAYANCDQRALIEERVYPYPPGGLGLMHLLNDVDKISDNVKNYEREVLKSRPNTYTYTKALAENFLMSSEARSLPLCIVRPSIITASLAEPVPGWVDNINGATGIIAGIGAGALRLLLMDVHKHLDMVPVDVVVNMILCAAKETSQNEKFKSPKVYNCCTSKDNQIKLRDMLQATVLNFRKSHSFPGIIWNPALLATTNKWWYKVNDCLFHYLPALLIDSSLLTISVKGFGLLESYRKLKRMTKSLEFFTLNEWQFVTDNMTQLFQGLSGEDQKRFYFDAREIQWSSYMKQYCLGIRQFIFKKTDETKSKKYNQLPSLYWIHMMLTCSFILFCGARLRSKYMIKSVAYK